MHHSHYDRIRFESISVVPVQPISSRCNISTSTPFKVGVDMQELRDAAAKMDAPCITKLAKAVEVVVVGLLVVHHYPREATVVHQRVQRSSPMMLAFHSFW